MARIHFIPISVLILLLGLGFLVAFLFVLIKSGRAGRWIFLGLVVLPILVVTGYLFLGFHRPDVYPAEVLESPLAVFEIPNRVSTADSVFWQENLEEEFIPDQYSSPKTAAYGLGAYVVPEMVTDLFGGQVPSGILVAEDRTEHDLLSEFQRGLKKAYEGMEIFINPIEAGSVPPEGHIWISLNLLEEPGSELRISEIQSGDTVRMAQQVNSGNRKGSLEVIVRTSKGKIMKTVSFDFRPWMTDFGNFKTAMAWSGRNWLKVSSQDTAVCPEEARRQVLQRAAQQISGIIRGPRALASMNSLGENELQQSGLIADEYSQRLRGIAGPIWRHAVLLDVSPERLQSLVAAKAQVIRVQRYTWMRLLLSLCGMILLVCAVYAVANAATKGYYSTVLAVSAVAAAVLLGLVILNFA